MQLITPFEFVSMFPERQTLAVIGNAPSVRDYELGEHIDSHDVVVRFNECALEGFARHVGVRTDILVTNPYREDAQRSMLDGGDARMVLVIASQTRRGEREIFERWVGDTPVMFTYSPDLVRVPGSEHQAGLTTGTYGLHLLLRVLKPSRLLLTGFTMFADSDETHYWTQVRAPGVSRHDLEREAVVFCNVLASARIPVEVTPDVMNIAQRHRVRLGDKVCLCRQVESPRDVKPAAPWQRWLRRSA